MGVTSLDFFYVDRFRSISLAPSFFDLVCFFFLLPSYAFLLSWLFLCLLLRVCMYIIFFIYSLFPYYKGFMPQWVPQNLCNSTGIIKDVRVCCVILQMERHGNKHFDRVYLDFAMEPRNVRLDWCIDGFTLYS